MPDPEVRRGPRPVKHLDILQAAVDLFGSKGVAHTTTREIAAAAGTTERTLFKHFGSKEVLVQAVLAEAVVAHVAPASLQQLKLLIRDEAGDLEAWHRALLQSRSSAMARSPELTRLLLAEMLRDPALLRQFGETWLENVWQPLESLLRGLQQAGRVRADIAPTTLGRVFLSLNLGYLLARHLVAPAADWQDADEIAGIARVFAAGTRPPGDS